MSDWTSRLRQASFRGVPFGVLGGDGVQGRRVAVHEYPGAEIPFIEDMGAAAGRIRLTGFLIEDSAIYGGGDVLGQRDRFRNAAAIGGSGLLVHPTRGPILVNLVTCAIVEKGEEQRFFTLELEFIETGAEGVVASVLDTAGAVLGAADGALSILGGLFGATADASVGVSGVAGPTGALSSLFGAQALSLGGGGVFGLGSTAGTQLLGSSVATFRSASAGLGLLTGAGGASAAAAAGVTQAISAVSTPGSAIDAFGGFAGLFG